MPKPITLTASGGIPVAPVYDGGVPVAHVDGAKPVTMAAAGRPVALSNIGAAFFLQGEPGAAYIPGLDTCFQDSSATTPCTAAGDPVGYIADQSGNGNHAIQATADSRPTLQSDSAGRWYLDFDGVADCLQVASFDMSSSDKVTACAAVRRGASGANQEVFELSADIAANDGACRMSFTSGNNFFWRTRGNSALRSTSDAGHAAVVDRVFTGQTDMSTESMTLRIDGVQEDTGGSGMGATNWGVYPLNIGSRNQSSNFFTGRIYSLIICGATLGDVDLAAAERWLAGASGVTL